MSEISFARTICGIDSSPQSMEAISQAFKVCPEDGEVWGASAWDPRLAMHASIHASTVRVDLRNESIAALTKAHEAFPELKLMLLRGASVSSLLSAAAEEDADLISVGSHGGPRLTGIAFGSVATAMVHHAPCSVLVARPPAGDEFPGLIVHASDGSADSLDAARVAGEIASRHGSSVIALNVSDDPSRGKALADEAASLIEQAGASVVAEAQQGSPHRGIEDFASSAGASLVVIGSRGMTGVRALGSVSERVAHRSPCSVLVVRHTSHPAQETEDRSALPS
ncbi:MAG TPA: universal stress protein [Solirubrobacterales bacterium]|nr:universal stress protein [Solirubrobacterales bacterium]